ncbi:MAG: mechanosensitive ion channel family protein [Gammaproteobacteria bacterium]|nr:mechanosensitive ion channel family protein [Gammaproteobacteria bacterium]
MNSIINYIDTLSIVIRIVAFASLAVIAHTLVVFIRRVAAHYLSKQSSMQNRKLRSIATLVTSAAVFTLYFLVVGLILTEFGVSLTAYLASASVLGLAIGFGSQGVVQDVVTGLTFIFSDLVDVGDLVEISGQTGIVKGITMRFVELQNALGASVFIPNRTISNVINYPRGYVRCIVDVTLRGDDENKKATENTATRLMQATHEQFPGILMTGPSSEGRIHLSSGKEFLRIKFRIWPNRGQPIETTYCQELTAALKSADPDYQTWMISIHYEVEAKKVQPQQTWSWRRLSTP